MARREAVVTITAEGRDKGKLFHIRELSAVVAEDWFARALQLLVRAGVEVPPNILEAGAMGFVTMGIGACLTGLGKAPYPEVKSLMEDMYPCVVGYQEAPGPTWVTILPVILDQVEEVGTLIKLREEIISLHLGFSLAARLSNYREAVALLIQGIGESTETSDFQSPSPSQAD